MFFVFSSKKILRIKSIDVFLRNFLVGFVEFNTAIYTNVFIGWGHKKTSEKLRYLAKKRSIPYLSLEDGFLRSLNLGVNNQDPLSLIIDQSGIYYDATETSDLEKIIINDIDDVNQLEHKSKKAVDLIVKNDLSKYNCSISFNCSKLSSILKDDEQNILIIDQTVGDASVSLGLASVKDFEFMLSEARRLYPRAQLYVKTHPDVLAGKKQGFLPASTSEDSNVTVISENISALSLLAHMDAVFCVTSQMGFEALLLGKKVYCFGMPFYAGWGLTVDYKKCARRNVSRSLYQVFAAAYILYPKYLNPVRNELCDIFDTIDRLSLQKKINEENRGVIACIGFSWWKKAQIRCFLKSTYGRLKFFNYIQPEKRAVSFAQKNQGKVVVWSSKYTLKLIKLCKKNHINLLRMEDGFVRSVGLGSDFNWPCSLVLDKSGIYYDPNTPSDLEKILQDLQKLNDLEDLRIRAEKIRKLIIEKHITKYNIGDNRVEALNIPKKAGGSGCNDDGNNSATGHKFSKIILVPGQVQDDASVRCGGLWIKSNLELLQKVRSCEPDAFIIYKPHPDVESGNRKGALSDRKILEYANVIAKNISIHELFKHVDEVHTLTSLSGFEALLRGIKVVTYGGPFYAGWGLTIDRAPVESSFFVRRTARLSLQDLIAGTLILYPRYYDYKTDSFCSCEDMIYRLSHPEDLPKGKFTLRTFASLRRLFNKLKIENLCSYFKRTGSVRIFKEDQDNTR